MKPIECKGCDETLAIYRLQNLMEINLNSKQTLPDEILICPFCGEMKGIKETIIQLPQQFSDLKK